MASSHALLTISNETVSNDAPLNKTVPVGSQTNNIQGTAPFNFIGLPYEIRSMVYRHCLAARTDGKRPEILHVIKGNQEYKDAVKQYKDTNFFLTITDYESNYQEFKVMRLKELNFRHFYLKLNLAYDEDVEDRGQSSDYAFNPFQSHVTSLKNVFETITIHLGGIKWNVSGPGWNVGIAKYLINASTRASTLVLRLELANIKELQEFLRFKDERGILYNIRELNKRLRMRGIVEVDGQSVVCVWRSEGITLKWNS